MDRILESLRYLYEDKAEYPKKCTSITYKILTNPHNLVLGSFVTEARLKHPELGFNIREPYYGRGSMIQTTQALLFLTKEDANAFAKKYNLDIEEIYLGKNFDTIVRIDANNDIPVYMQLAAIDRSRMTNTQLANADADETSVNNVASAEILQANAKYAGRVEEANKIDRLSQVLIQDLIEKNLTDKTISTKLGSVKISTECDLISKHRFNVKLKIEPLDLDNFKQVNDNWHKLYVFKSPSYPKDIKDNFINPIVADLKNKFHFKNHAYHNEGEPSVLFDLSHYNGLDLRFSNSYGQNFTHKDFDADLGRWLKLTDEEAKIKFEDALNNQIADIKHDFDEAANLRDYLAEVTAELNDKETIEVSYADFQK